MGTSNKPGTHIALVRGLNVGGKNRLPMKDLAAAFEQAGCSEVRTYIQSGNVVFRAANPLAARIATIVARELGERFGIRTPVITRTAAELRKAVSANPFPEAVRSPKSLHVGFLAKKPTAAALATLDPDRSPPDQFTVRDREIYVLTPDGLARTKLTNSYFDSRLAIASTMRNWNTVLELLHLCKVMRHE